MSAVLAEKRTLEGRGHWFDPDAYVTPLDHCDPAKRLAICEAMIDVASALFGVSSKDLRSPQRCEKDIARVRQIAMYVCHTTLGISLTEVGRGFSRDRTTVSYAVQVIEDLRDDREFDSIIEQVERIARAAFVAVEERAHD